MSYRPFPLEAQHLTAYFGESDRWQGKPLYLALLETLKAHGLAGGTVTCGVAGFGAHSIIHTAAILRLSTDLPLRLEVWTLPNALSRRWTSSAPCCAKDCSPWKPSRWWPTPIATCIPMSAPPISAQADEPLGRAVQPMVQGGTQAAAHGGPPEPTGGDALPRGCAAHLGQEEDMTAHRCSPTWMCCALWAP